MCLDETQMESSDAHKNDNDKSDGSADDSSRSDTESDTGSESGGDQDMAVASSRDDEYQSNADDVSNIIDITGDICDRSESQVNPSFIESSLLPDNIHNAEIAPGMSKEITVTANEQKKKSKKISKRKFDESSADIHLRIANMKKKILKMENKIKKV